MATTETKLDLSKAIEASRAFVIAKKGFQATMRALEREIAPLGDDEFWPLVEKYREQVLTGFRLHQESKAMAHNLLEEEEEGEARTLKLMAFAKAWGAKKGAAYRPLFDAIQDRGDDGYGDFLDSFPLVGREVYEKALTGCFANEAALEDAAREALRELVTAASHSEWRDDEENAEAAEKALTGLLSHVFNGENYHEMALKEKARDSFCWTFSVIR